MRRHRSANRSLTVIGVLGALAPLHGAQAQGGGACEQFKASLAARIDPSIGGFSLEVVPASTAVPAGAKVIGTCEGGARKVLLRRQTLGAAKVEPAGAANADAPASAPTAVTEVPGKARRAASAAAGRASAAVESRGVASVPAPAREVVPAKPAPTPLAANPSPDMPTPMAASASQPSEAATHPPVPAAAPDVAPAAPALLQRSAALAAEYWPWLAGLVLVLLAGPLWAWFAHRRAYDASGLPRGPRLN